MMYYCLLTSIHPFSSLTSSYFLSTICSSISLGNSLFHLLIFYWICAKRIRGVWWFWKREKKRRKKIEQKEKNYLEHLKLKIQFIYIVGIRRYHKGCIKRRGYDKLNSSHEMTDCRGYHTSSRYFFSVGDNFKGATKLCFGLILFKLHIIL